MQKKMFHQVNFNIKCKIAIQVAKEQIFFFRDTRNLDLASQNPLRARSQCTQNIATVYLETPNCRHTATLAVDSLFLSTLKEQSGKAKAGEVLCMRCGNIWYRKRVAKITRLHSEVLTRIKVREEEHFLGALSRSD